MIEFEVIKRRMNDNAQTPVNCQEIRALMIRGGTVFLKEQIFDMLKTEWYRFFVLKGVRQSFLMCAVRGHEHYVRTIPEDTPEDSLLHLPTF